MHCLASKDGLLNPTSAFQHQLTIAFCAIGGAGVDIFFVISGFIIVSLAQRRVAEVNRFSEATRFLLRRWGRIYPLYWVTVVVILASTSWYTRNDPNYHSTINIREILLVTTQVNVQPPAWTLSFELWFYFGTAVLMLLPPTLFTKAMLVWATAQATLLLLHSKLGVGPSSHIFIQPQVMDFFLGCAVSYMCAHRLLSPSHAVMILLLSIGLFTAGCISCYLRLPTGSLTDGERLIYWGTSAAIMLWSLICLEVTAALKTPIWLQRLGDVSYSIYLWHFPIMTIAFSFGLEDLIPSSKILQALLEFLVTLLIAPFSYRVIEFPFMKLVQKLSQNRGMQSVVPTIIN